MESAGGIVERTWLEAVQLVGLDLQIALVLFIGGTAAVLKWFRYRQPGAVQRRPGTIEDAGRPTWVTRPVSIGAWLPGAWRTNP